MFLSQPRVILMVSRASTSALAWWARAAQARRVANMLSPRDAQLAEAYALECEDYARKESWGAVRSVRPAANPKRILFCGKPLARGLA